MLMSIVTVSTLAFMFLQPWRWLLIRRILVIYATLAFIRFITVLTTKYENAREWSKVGEPSRAWALARAGQVETGLGLRLRLRRKTKRARKRVRGNSFLARVLQRRNGCPAPL